MYLFVVDHWTQSDGNSPEATRPWLDWHGSARPCRWNLDLEHRVDPLSCDFLTPAFVIVHWSHLNETCGSEKNATTDLEKLVSAHDDVFVVVMSADGFGKTIDSGRLYFRKAPVSEKDKDDAFRSYLCEFFTHLKNNHHSPDFTLLEPEAPPVALAWAQAEMTRGNSIPHEMWREAERQCRRIISRGNGHEPFAHPEFVWLSNAAWPDDFLRDCDAQKKFVNAVSSLLEAFVFCRGEA